MTTKVPVLLRDSLARYVTQQAQVKRKSPAEVVESFLQEWYETKTEELHASYLKGDITLRGMAAQLGLSYRELYELLEEKGLSF